jgi:hypothetical protein
MGNVELFSPEFGIASQFEEKANDEDGGNCHDKESFEVIAGFFLSTILLQGSEKVHLLS